MPQKAYLGNGKSLKGDAPASNNISLEDITNLSAPNINGGYLEGVSIYGNSADDIQIGFSVPSDAYFKKVTIGHPMSGDRPQAGYSFTAYGNIEGDYILWDPDNGIFNINGSISVRDSAQFGNLRIRENFLEAINTDGDVILLPEGQGTISLAGPLNQIQSGAVSFDYAKSFTTNSASDIQLTSATGNMSFLTDFESSLKVYDIQSVTFVEFPFAHLAIETKTDHNLVVNDTVIVSGTNSVPVVDGEYIVSTIPDSSHVIFAIALPLQSIGTISGTIKRKSSGKIDFDTTELSISNAKVTFLQDLVDRKVNCSINSSHFLETSGTRRGSLSIMTDYLRLQDPIVSLINTDGQQKIRADSGILSLTENVSRFFGFSKNEFTILKDAIVTIDSATGAKIVSGTKLGINVESITTTQIKGSPNLVISSDTGDVIFQSSTSFSIPDNVPFHIGTIGLYRSVTSSGLVLLQSNFDLRLQVPASNRIQIPTDSRLSFNDTPNCEQTVYGSSDGLHVKVKCGHLFLDAISPSCIKIPYETRMDFGTTSSISTASSGLVISSSSNIQLSPVNSIQIPDLVKLEFGNSGQSFIRANDTLKQLEMTSVGTTIITSTKDIFLKSATTGSIFVNSPTTIFSTNSQIQLGTSLQINNFSGNFNIIAAATMITATSPYINLNAGVSVTIPVNVPIVFGASGRISLSPTTGSLHISNTGTKDVIIDADTVINGDLRVNGVSTYVHSTVTTFSDSILSLGIGSPIGDVKDRGIEFIWSENGQSSTGFMGFQQTRSAFVLIKDGINVNEQFTGAYGDLIMNDLFANNITLTSLTTSLIIGNPDLRLIASGSIFLDSTTSVVIPVGIPIFSMNNKITGTVNGWDISGKNVNITNGSLSISNASFKLTDINNLHISNVQHIWLDAVVHVPNVIRFADSGSISMESENIRISTSGNIIMASPTTIGNGMFMGNSSMTWSPLVRGGGILWHSTLSGTPLVVSYAGGSIIDANWEGNSIGISSGGTGHLGSWSAGSVVFVGSTNTSLDEDNANFYWNQTLQRLGLRTRSVSSTLTIGIGDIEFLSPSAKLKWTLTNSVSYEMGVSVSGTVWSLARRILDTTQSVFLANAYGQIGISHDEYFMMGLLGTELESKLYVNGSISLIDNSNVKWTSTEYINASSGYLSLYASLGIRFQSTLYAKKVAFDNNEQIYISGNDFQKSLTLSAPDVINLQSTHVLVDQKLCFMHNNGICQMYVGKNIDGNLSLVSHVSDIYIQPMSRVFIENGKSISLGSAGSIGSTNESILQITCNSLLTISATDRISIDLGTLFTFANVTRMIQHESAFNIWSDTNIIFGSNVGFNTNTNLYFSSMQHRIVSDGQALRIFGSDMIVLDSNNVKITGNLIVTGQTSINIVAETHIDSGILTMGGAQSLNILNLVPIASSTRILVDTVHNLVVGDKVQLLNTVPDIDGIYLVSDIQDTTSFVIDRFLEQIPLGTQITGVVRSSLISNPEVDVGLEVHYHTGESIGTVGARNAYFGFKRSTRRWTYYVTGQNVGGVFNGVLGDIEVGTVYAQFLNAAYLAGPLNAENHILSGSNFRISGGTLDNTIIGLFIPAPATFTNVTITGNLLVSGTNVVTNLNADLLDGFNSSDFILRNGTVSLSADWDAGNYRITASGLTDTSLTANCIVFAGSSGKLQISNDFYFIDSILSVKFLNGTSLKGTLNLEGQNVTNGFLNSVSIFNSSFVLSNSVNILDTSAGTVVMGTGQIFGSWVAGGTADIDISGNAGSVTNGVYSFQFNEHSILKADSASTPVSLSIPESTFVGRKAGGIISALTLPEVRQMLGIGAVGEESVYNQGAVLRSGDLEYAQGGTMTGNLYPSYEILSLETNSTTNASINCKYTFVTLNYSAGHEYATLGLPNGKQTPQEKVIILVNTQQNSALHVICNCGAPNEESTTGFIMQYANQSIQLVWFAQQSKWFIVPTGASTF